MKYLYIKIVLILIAFFDLIPHFFFRCIFFCLNRNFKKQQIIKHKDVNSNKVLIWMDYSNAIGDFFIILESIIKYDQIGNKLSVLVHKKFAGIIEQLDLKNIEIIYKENSLGKHYLKEKTNLIVEMNKIDKEFLDKQLSFDKIYYFNGILLSDALTSIRNISYNELITIDPKFFLRGKNSKFIDRNFIKLSLFYLSQKKQFKIKTIYTKQYKKYSLTDIIENQFNLKSIKKEMGNDANENYCIIAAGASNATKVLKQETLLSVINKISENFNKIFVGSDFDKKFIESLIDSNNKEFNFEFNLELVQLFELVKNSSLVISYDTGLYHIANFLDKKTCLILNEDDFAYKYMSKYWLGEQKMSNQRVIFKKKFFYK